MPLFHAVGIVFIERYLRKMDFVSHEVRNPSSGVFSMESSVFILNNT